MLGFLFWAGFAVSPNPDDILGPHALVKPILPYFESTTAQPVFLKPCKTTT